MRESLELSRLGCYGSAMAGVRLPTIWGQHGGGVGVGTAGIEYGLRIEMPPIAFELLLEL